MKSSKTKSDSELSRKAAKRKVKKDLQKAISQKLMRSIKTFGVIGNKIEKDLSKVSKRLAKKLANELKDIGEDFKKMQTQTKAAIGLTRKPKQTSLAKAKKIVTEVIKTNKPTKARTTVKRRVTFTPKKSAKSSQLVSNTSTIQSDNTTLTAKPAGEKSDVSTKL